MKSILKIIKNILFIFGIIVSIIILFALLMQIIVFIIYKFEYPNLRIKEADVKQQIEDEASELDKYQPIISYIKEYKAKNGVYPKELPQKYKDITSDKFAMFDYHVLRYDDRKCIIEILPKHGPIQYYRHKSLCNLDKHDAGIKRGFVDTNYYYDIGSEWQAIYYKFYTRYTDRFSVVDICLDDGGCYDYIRHRCEFHDNGYCYKNETDCVKNNRIWQEDKKYCKLK